MHFEPTEENKLIYTDIFKKYHEIIEAYITQVILLFYQPDFCYLETYRVNFRLQYGKLLVDG